MTIEQLETGNLLSAQLSDLKDFIAKVEKSNVIIANERGNEVLSPPVLNVTIHPEQMAKFKTEYLEMLYAKECELLKQFEQL